MKIPGRALEQCDVGHCVYSLRASGKIAYTTGMSLLIIMPPCLLPLPFSCPPTSKVALLHPPSGLAWPVIPTGRRTCARGMLATHVRFLFEDTGEEGRSRHSGAPTPTQRISTFAKSASFTGSAPCARPVVRSTCTRPSGGHSERYGRAVRACEPARCRAASAIMAKDHHS
jgi:hypothetical protein